MLLAALPIGRHLALAHCWLLKSLNYNVVHRVRDASIVQHAAWVRRIGVVLIIEEPLHLLSVVVADVESQKGHRVSGRQVLCINRTPLVQVLNLVIATITFSDVVFLRANFLGGGP